MSEIIIDSETVFTGKIITVRKDRVRLPDNRQGTREVVNCADAVAIVALTDVDEVLMVKQYRHPTSQELWEIPAGKIEAGEDPLSCAQRELEEETGYRAGDWHQICSFYTSPGFCTEQLHLLLARDLTKYNQKPDQDEFIEVEKIPVSVAVQMVTGGEILDAKTIIGLLTAEKYIRKIYK
ncbi:NUDIX domain-containing protein [Desulfallas thermosapovorans]|uniref:ADP-ribose pyrophosphatase n=1 Tax=Desulfallas thermosapovorans DSM 6562 TaxID=1121431 RepID=A0A5S4ZXT2_9FIRM|nr:NUDIX hydrolase [Desulfallas thermosapovorans]TYO97822.1 ADP-ribose pyrophosphatase [Desulfallas thermosapovorans DSM 6562]